MKNIKKIIALILALIMLTGTCLMSSSAAVIFGIEIGEEKEDEDSLLKWLSYANGKNTNVQCVLVPGATLVSEEGYTTITRETPLAFDHEFIYWEDDQGNIYYPGEQYYVTGLDTLYAVWKDKTDNDSHLIRVIKTSLAALSRLLSFVFGFYEFEEDFSRQYFATSTDASEAA